MKHDHSPQPDDRDCDDGIPKYLLHHVLLEATFQEKHFSTLVTKDEVMGKVMPPNLLYKMLTARLTMQNQDEQRQQSEFFDSIPIKNKQPNVAQIN